MSNATQIFSPTNFKPTDRCDCSSRLRVPQRFQISGATKSSRFGSLVVSAQILDVIRAKKTRFSACSSVDGQLQDLDLPVSVELQPILSEGQFDRVIAEAQQLEDSLVLLWMASWCRKCIYLKPKLEKLAADYHPRIQFYCIDVNRVPHRLVARAGVTKMPTIQLWKDGKKQDEVIGGHKAHLVINEVREMIENEGAL